MRFFIKFLFIIALPITLITLYLKRKKGLDMEKEDVEILSPIIEKELISPLSVGEKQLTLNFKLTEFSCKDGTPVPIEYLANCQELANNLQILRDYLNRGVSDVKNEISILINSAYRHKVYNNKIGGAKSSQHLTCSASDIVVKGKTPLEIQVIVKYLIVKGLIKQGGVGGYNTFTHYDIRGTKARW